MTIWTKKAKIRWKIVRWITINVIEFERNWNEGSIIFPFFPFAHVAMMDWINKFQDAFFEILSVFDFSFFEFLLSYLFELCCLLPFLWNFDSLWT